MRRVHVSILTVILGVTLSLRLDAQDPQIALAAPVVAEGQQVSGVVENVAAGQGVDVTWTDPFGGVFFAATLMGDADSPPAFSFTASGAPTPVNYLGAASGDGVGTRVFTVMPADDALWRGFVTALDSPLPVKPANANAAVGFGANAALAAGYQGAVAAGGSGLRAIVTGLVSAGVLSVPKDAFDAAAQAYAGDHDAKSLERTPSLSDAAEIDRLAGEISRQVPLVRTVAPAGLIVAEEPSTGWRNAPLDLVFAQADLDGLATYAESRLPEDETGRATQAFAPLSALDMKARMTRFGSLPLNISAWALAREYADGRLAESILELSRAAKSAARSAGEDNINWNSYGVLTGFTGGMAPSAYGGYDWTTLPIAVDFAIMAGDAPNWSWALARDVSTGGRVLARIDAKAGDATDAVWEAVGDGMAGIVLDGAGGLIAQSAPAAAPAPRLRREARAAQAEATGDAAQGAAPAAAGVESTAPEGAGGAGSEGVSLVQTLADIRCIAEFAANGQRAATAAIVYSPKSVRAGWMMDYAGMETSDFAAPEAGTQALAAWPAILDDLGIDYTWVSIDSVPDGALVTGSQAMAVLPETWCVSPEAAGALSDYVSQGGLLVADNGAGLFDDNYSAYPASPLDAVFGVTRRPLTGKRAALVSAGNANASTLGATADADLAVATGAKSKPSDLAPIMITNRLEGGGSAYLNRFVGAYLSAGADERKALLSDMREVLAVAGVSPKVAVYDASRRVAVRVKSCIYDRSQEFFIYPADDSRPDPGTPVEVRFPVAGDYYNMRTLLPAGEYLGSGTSFEVAMPASGPIVISGTDLPINSIDLTSDYANGVIYFTARFVADEPVGNRLVQLEFYGPSGRRVAQFDRIVTAQAGVYMGSETLPANATPGNWRVVVRDVQTCVARWTDIAVE